MDHIANNKKKNTDNLLNTYIDRNRFWTQQALNQLGFTSNFFFLISTSFFVFLIKENNIKDLFHIDIDLKMSLSKIGVLISLLFVFISILYGALTVLSRLNDLRLTRHITETRRKYYKKTRRKILDKNDSTNTKNKYVALWQSLVNSKKIMISKEDFYDKEEINRKIGDLRIYTKLLSEFSWMAIKIQIATLVISLLLFFITSII